MVWVVYFRAVLDRMAVLAAVATAAVASRALQATKVAAPTFGEAADGPASPPAG